MWTSLPRIVLAILLLSQSTAAIRRNQGAVLETVASQPSTILPDNSNKEIKGQSSSINTTIPFLRGVNLGGWLVLESWMDDTLFSGRFADAVDQWTFDSISGAEDALEHHWSTFLTESDIKDIAATGINALRIPIGYWAYNNTNTPYIKGADRYLEKAIGWARNHEMKVWIDCHGSPGSQNGFGSSGRQGETEWQEPANLLRSTSVLKTMAAKYGAMEYADIVVGLQLTNEPLGSGTNKFSTTKSWAQDAYKAVAAEVANKDLVIVMHDAFQGPLAWKEVAESLNTGDHKPTFGIDTHIYQVYGRRVNQLTQSQHINKVCNWERNLADANQIMPTYVGEWSSETNICVSADGSTIAGTSCSSPGCQCQSEPFSTWKPELVKQVRRFVEAQMDVFEASTSGYFMWAAKGPGGWGFLNGISKGIIPNPVTSRKYPGQCKDGPSKGGQSKGGESKGGESKGGQSKGGKSKGGESKSGKSKGAQSNGSCQRG